VTIKGHTLDKLFEKFGDGDLWHWWWDYKPLTSTSWLINVVQLTVNTED